MAIIADYTFQGLSLRNVYIRPQSIGGAKNYNWACSFAVFVNEELSQNFDNNIAMITVSFPWKDSQDVYADAYKAMQDHPLLTNIKRG